jgi:hypothetical protein
MKSQFQDIIPPEKRSIRNVPLSANPENVPKPVSRTESIRPKDPIPKEQEPESESVEADSHEYLKPSYSKSETLVFKGKNTPGMFSRLMLWLLTVCTAGALFLVLTYYYASADISIELRKFSSDLPQKVQGSLKPSEDQMEYSVITISDTMEMPVDYGAEKEVKEYAKGTIVVYNKYDSNPQKFTEGTRFETVDGKIFRTTKSVTVPGYKKTNNTVVPGSILVDVIADVPGEEYNIDLTDFTIPGLKNDPRFDSFYGRSKTKMAGGLVGKIPEISKENQDKVLGDIQDKLSKEINEKIRKEIPKNHILVDGLSSVEFKTLPPKINGKKAMLSAQATLKAYIIPNKSFVKTVLGDKSPSIDPGDEFLITLDGAKASVSESVSTTTEGVYFNLAGKTTIQYVFNTDEFKTSILGKSKGEILKNLSQNPAVNSININIKPFWKEVVPVEPGKINVSVK